ncbi:hypothetical protein SAMN05216456_3597 [Devosia crocina]|uniref:Uncharacterized protein n=1 Tax=Devosia crocina TaxID=429728 RepID=A0A1I7NVQ3_9HYPH|nr:hypothetical protein SAMN05216456_3597 [Devosia crocina]
MVTVSDSGQTLSTGWEWVSTDKKPAVHSAIGRTSMLHFDSVT